MSVSPPHGPSFDQDTMTAKSPLYARRGPLTSKEIHDADSRFTRMSHARPVARRRASATSWTASAIARATRS